MKHERIDPAVERILEELRDVPPPDPVRQASLRAEYLARAAAARTAAAVPAQGVRARAPLGQGRGRPALARGKPRTAALSLVRIAALLILVAATGSAGLAYAADGAVPGEALYGLDRAVESARLAVTTRPGAKAHLLLAHASERLDEAAAVAPGGDPDKLSEAWAGYGASLAAMMQSTAMLAARGDGAAVDRVDETLAGHAQRWAQVLDAAGQSGASGTVAAGRGADACSERGLQEEAVQLARHYGIEYDDVASWMCAHGHAPGEVLLAIEIGRAAGVPAGEMLRHREAGKEWGAIYRERADGVPGRQDPGPRDDPGASPGQGPGGGGATPGEGERRGQEPLAEESPEPEKTSAPGGKPDDAGQPASTGAPGGNEAPAPGGPGPGGAPGGGTPTPGGPGQESGPHSGTSSPGGRGP
jgi:hypothetical protein